MKDATEPAPVLPEIPRKRYFAIGEVSDLCAVKPHVLRYWEQEFPQLKPVKRRGNRRYYQHEDVMMVRRIRHLLYDQGFTIGGARQRLRELPRQDGTSTGLDGLQPPVAAATDTQAARKQRELRDIRNELESLLKRWPY
jgi:DNA-binding transcriptional MerR regulator